MPLRLVVSEMCIRDRKHDTQAGTAALPAVTAGAAAAQAPDADADGATPPTEPVESVAAEKTDPPEPVAPDTEAIPVRRQRPVPPVSYTHLRAHET